MNILITGATGYFGRALTVKLHSKENSLYLLGRSKNKMRAVFEPLLNADLPFPVLLDYTDRLPLVDIVINLAGESIADKILTQKRLNLLLSSRIKVLNHLESGLKSITCSGQLFIQASAVGIYAESDRAGEDLTLDNDPLALICQKVEKQALKLTGSFKRIVPLRLGIILGDNCPFLNKIKRLPDIKFIGPQKHIGWISIEDAVNAVIFIINNKNITASCNLVAPNAAARNELMAFKEKSFLPTIYIPSLMLKFGDKRGLLLDKEQNIVPKNLLNHGFIFKFKTLNELKKHLTAALT